MLIIEPKDYGYFDVRTFRASRDCPEYKEKWCLAKYVHEEMRDVALWRAGRIRYECPYRDKEGAVWTYRVNDDCCEAFKQAAKQLGYSEADLAKLILALLGALVLKG